MDANYFSPDNVLVGPSDACRRLTLHREGDS